MIDIDFSNNKVVGIDEAGRGPLSGPVVAGAVLHSENFPILRDSKKLTENQRNKLYKIITSEFHYGIGIATVEEIDQYNILNATKLAMKRAYDNLNISANLVLIDGNFGIDITESKVIPVIKGDALYPVISAASIIAKVYRDQIMNELSLEYPHYFWNKNKGYGTKDHLNAIKSYGITEHHRRSFAPVAQQDRVLLSESNGRGFKSLRVHQK